MFNTTFNNISIKKEGKIQLFFYLKNNLYYILIDNTCINYFRFSWAKAFWDLLKELHDLAGQHEVIAENTQGSIIKETIVLIQDYKGERKKVIYTLCQFFNTVIGLCIICTPF